MWSPEPIAYVCHGARVASRITLPFPLADRGTGPVDVTIEPGPVDTPALAVDREADFFVDEGDLILTIRGVARFRASAGARIVVDAEADAKEEDVRLYLNGSVLGAIWLQRGLLPLHASAVELPTGGCVAFAGRSGAGKSSLAAAFVSSGHRLVADDVCVLVARDDGYSVYPGSPRMKLAPDALEAMNRSKETLRRAGGTREKYHLEAVVDSPGGGAEVPLRALFLLSYAQGPPRMTRLTGLDAVDAIGGHTYRQEFVRPLGLEEGWLRCAASVARVVPLFRLHRPPGLDRVAGVVDTILATARDGRNSETVP